MFGEKKRRKKTFDTKLYSIVGFSYVVRAVCLPIGVLALAGALLSQGLPICYQVATVAFSLVIFFSFIYWVGTSRVVCRLCRTPLLKRMKISRSKKKTLSIFGDRALPAALGLTFRKKAICCQHCAEKQVYFGRPR